MKERLFRKNMIIFYDNKDVVLERMKKNVKIRYPVQYNFASHGQTNSLLGIVDQDSFHLTSNYSFFNSWQVVCHGTIESIDKKSCKIVVRFFPNNQFLFILLVCAALISIALVKNMFAFSVTLTGVLLFLALFVAVSIAFTFLSLSQMLELLLRVCRWDD